MVLPIITNMIIHWNHKKNSSHAGENAPMYLKQQVADSTFKVDPNPPHLTLSTGQNLEVKIITTYNGKVWQHFGVHSQLTGQAVITGQNYSFTAWKDLTWPKEDGVK